MLYLCSRIHNDVPTHKQTAIKTKGCGKIKSFKEKPYPSQAQLVKSENNVFYHKDEICIYFLKVILPV